MCKVFGHVCEADLFHKFGNVSAPDGAASVAEVASRASRCIFAGMIKKSAALGDGQLICRSVFTKRISRESELRNSSSSLSQSCSFGT